MGIYEKPRVKTRWTTTITCNRLNRFALRTIFSIRLRCVIEESSNHDNKLKYERSWFGVSIRLTTIIYEHKNNIVENANRKKFLHLNDMALHFSDFFFCFSVVAVFFFFMPICNLVEKTNNLCSTTMTKERMCNVKQTMANATRWAHMFAVLPVNVHVHVHANHVSFEWANNTDFLFQNTAAFLCHII